MFIHDRDEAIGQNALEGSSFGQLFESCHGSGRSTTR